MEIMYPARLDQDIMPVFRLPNEILTVIFILYARHYYYYDFRVPDVSPRSMAPTWVNISYVCRHWRNVSMNCQELWSYVSVTSQRWMEELLARSNRVPLKIYADFSLTSKSLSLPHALEQVADHVERIEELDFYLSFPNCDCQLLSKFLSAPAPRLRSLEISHLTTSEKPFLLFQGQTPALRRLDLSYCSVRVLWDSFPLNCLTTLGLHLFLSDFRLSMVELLAILGHMPSLEHLELEGALACARGFLLSNAFTTTARIYLSRLSYLSITAPISTLTAFMSCVDMPLKAQLALGQTGDTIATPDEYNRFLHLLRQRFDPSLDGTALSAPTIRSLAIRNHLRWLEVACSTSEQLPKYPKKRDSSCVLVVTLKAVAPVEDDRMIWGICSCMPLADVEILFFHYIARSSSFWRIILGRLPNLKGIKHWNGPGDYTPYDMASLLCWTSGTSTGHWDMNFAASTLTEWEPVIDEYEDYDYTMFQYY